jgi:hypothetical protein
MNNSFQFRTREQIVSEGMNRVSKLENPTPEQIQVILNWVAKETEDLQTYMVNHHHAMAQQLARKLRHIKEEKELDQYLNSEKYKEELDIY